MDHKEEKQESSKDYEIQLDENKFKVNIEKSKEENNLTIKVSQIGITSGEFYSGNFDLEALGKIDKLFRQYDKIDEVIEFFTELFEDNSIKINNDKGDLKIVAEIMERKKAKEITLPLVKNEISKNTTNEALPEKEGKQLPEIENKEELAEKTNINKEKASDQMAQEISQETKELIEFIKKVSNSKKELTKKCLKIFEENGIASIEDLLILEANDIDSFGFQLIFKKKLINELNKLRPKSDITDTEKTIIRSLFEKELTIDEILTTLKVEKDTPKADSVKTFYESLKPELKPIPKDLKKLYVKTGSENVLPCFHYPAKQIIGKKYFTLLVMGETGSGKTTLLDAFVNYLTGINYEDEWRFKLVDENHIKDVPSGESQTSVITSYFINYQRKNDENQREINIRIIDTPGLGDTKGILQDNKIIKQFENLFKEIGELDYILVTVKANTTRWTQQNQYVYDRILEVFGKDALERFMLMCTFSDGQIPLALKVLKNKLAYQDYFCFNNSALYVPSKKAPENTKFFWKLGMSNVKKFFNIILDKNFLPLSLNMSKQVMENREWLFASVESSKERINAAFSLLEQSNKLLEAIKKNEKQLDENGSFEYEDDEERTRTVPLPKAYQYCGNCGCLCCQICEWPYGAELSRCTYFNGGRGCPRCPGNCRREDHLRADHIKEKYTVRVKKVYNAKKELYEESKKGLSLSEAALNEQISKMSSLGKNILKDMESIKKSLIELDKIALKPRVFTNEQYFKEMIDYEEQSKNPGYESRVEGLKMMKEQAKQLNDISKASSITELFPQYDKIIHELKSKKPEVKDSSCLIM